MKKFEQSSPYDKFNTSEAQDIINRQMLDNLSAGVVRAYATALIEKYPDDSNFNHVNHVRDAIGHPALPLIVYFGNPNDHLQDDHLNDDLQCKTSYFICVLNKSTGEALNEKEIAEDMVRVGTWDNDGNLVEVSPHFKEEQAWLVFEHAQELAKLGLLDEVTVT